MRAHTILALLVPAIVWSSAGVAAAQSAKDAPTIPPDASRVAATPAKAADEGPQPAQPKIVEEGIFPKSIKIPGTDLSLSIGGYVKVDFIQDFSAIGNASEFQTSSIPVEGTAAAGHTGRTTIQAKETRFNLDLRSHRRGGNFRAFVEGDFYGSGNAFRLRHGFGEFGPLLGGQTWTTYMDISARPLTLDFEGPDGELFVRQAMLRWTQTVGSAWSWAVAVESPGGQFAIPSGLSGVVQSNAPDFPAHVRYQHGKGHVQIAGVLRQLRFAGSEGVSDASTAGFGVNATFVLNAFGRDQIQGQFMIGEGTARYIEALQGQNVDAVLSPSGDLDALRSQGGVVGYTHHWSERVKSGLAYSTASVDDNPALSGSTLERVQDFRVNAIWTPYTLVDVGGEVLWGRRENQDGSHGDAWRFQFAVIYRLN